jgi:acyl-CoA reductase-like NAD-dependent aldehyde dehydrogenase
VGVVGLITPWNFPVAIPAWKLAPALVAGNTVVLKPSEEAPVSALHLARCPVDAGLPAAC